MLKFLTSDYAILLTLILGGMFLIRPHLWVVRRMWFDEMPWARTATRVTLGTIGVFVVWITVLDNWRQMLGYLVAENDRWKSDLYLSAPPSDPVRYVSLGLVVASILGAAYLYARYARGYFIPIIAGPIGLAVFYALNGFRMRFDVVGSLWQGGVDWTSPFEVGATLTWFGVEQCIMFVLLVSAFSFVWGPTAIVVSVIYRRTIGRETVVEPAMYRILRERTVARKQHDARG